MVMTGVIGVYIELKSGEELFTDYIGVGSIIGQYSMFDRETTHFGFRACSDNGVLLVQLQIDALNILEKQSQPIRDLKTIVERDQAQYGIHQVDFIS
jgi:CRP-like cAMP-binding protein